MSSFADRLSPLTHKSKITQAWLADDRQAHHFRAMTNLLTSPRSGRFAVLLLALFALSACASAAETDGKRENLNTHDRFVQSQLGGA